MGKPWYTVEELSARLKISTSDIDRLLVAGMLTPYACFPLTPLEQIVEGAKRTRVSCSGMFELVGYEKIVWSRSSGMYCLRSCDLRRCLVRLRQSSNVYAFVFAQEFSASDVLILNEDVARYENALREQSVAVPAIAATTEKYNPNPEEETPEEYIVRRRAEGELDEVIAVELSDPRKRFRLRNLDIVNLFALDEGLNEDQHKTKKQRGQRFRNAGMKILQDRSGETS